MLQRLRYARLLWPTLAALAGLAVLIGLGTWQMERKRWKEGLIAKIAERTKAPPIALYLKRNGPGQLLVAGDLEYLHVAETGRFHHDKERYLYAPTAAGIGWHVYTPLELQPGSFVWVNRGWVPDARKAPETRPEGQAAGEVEVRGLVRLPKRPSRFAAENDPSHNIWYWPDIAAMTASAFPTPPEWVASTPEAGKLRPLVIEADAEPAPPGGLPRGGVTRLELPNRHLEYALTWYGLAATLAGVYLAFAINRLRATA